MRRPGLPPFAQALVTLVLLPAGAVAAPEVTISTPRDGEVVWGQVRVAGTSSGATSIQVQVDDGPLRAATGSAAWNLTLGGSDLDLGAHRITAHATGSSGTETAETVVIASPESPPDPDCSRPPGATFPGKNPAAPATLDLGDAPVVYLEIIGHSESQRYGEVLQQLLDADPPEEKTYVVRSHVIGGHETWHWVKPGDRGFEAIEAIISDIRGPTLALILTTNNVTYPASVPDMSDQNYARFVSECESMADHLWNDGRGVVMSYFSAHRLQPKRIMQCYYENLAIGDLARVAGEHDKPYIKPGPEQHDLHWCCFPDCYGDDFVHPNLTGVRLMAETWFRFLEAEIAPGMIDSTMTDSTASDSTASDSTATDTTTVAVTPVPLRLGEPFPNPSGHVARLPISIDHEMEVDLGLFDVSGRLVNRYRLGVYPPGEHQVEIGHLDTEGRPVASGVYWVRLLDSPAEAVSLLILR